MEKIKALPVSKLAILLMLLFPGIEAYSQDEVRAINDQVWKPFTEAIMSQDQEKFISVHSRDVIRVERDSKKILRYDEYKSNMTSWSDWKKSLQQSGAKYLFELRFLERISDGDIAHEVGYFKNETTSADGQTRKSYGKFHVVLRKESGTWKILVDSDSNEGRSITDSMFVAASPLE